jgi:hypothetical protein
VAKPLIPNPEAFSRKPPEPLDLGFQLAVRERRSAVTLAMASSLSRLLFLLSCLALALLAGAEVHHHEFVVRDLVIVCHGMDMMRGAPVFSFSAHYLKHFV